MKIYFPSDEKSALFDSPAFMKIMQFVASHPNRFDLKQSSKTVIMMVKSVENMNRATDVLSELQQLYEFK